MTVHRENDPVRLREPFAADVVGEGRSVVIPAGAVGAVVLVHGNPSQPMAYEVEFYIQDQGCYALAVMEAGCPACAPLPGI
ncbi:MAG: hypothetical protein AB7I35_00670 [Ramlibacter sp.]|nr:hypothetical protein [Ramlibacter sp.]